jgi:hypothetical protein
MESIDTSLHDVGWRVEVGLADLKVDDLLALLFQSAGTVQNFKGSLCAETRHPAG